MFSADGCVSLWVTWNKKKKIWEIKKYVKISNYSSNIRKGIVKILLSLGFSPTNRESNREVVLFKKSDLIKFHREIGFVKGVKITKNSRYWNGLEKNYVLKLVINSFGVKKSELKKFKTKIEVIDFLRRKFGSDADVNSSQTVSGQGSRCSLIKGGR